MKILLVEDSRAVAAVMSSRLAAFGHDVRLAENGKIALDMFRREAPDLVLMDVEMPVMNGFEAASRIRAIEAEQPWAWTPIIFLTATATDGNLITAIEAGGDDFMAKTVSEPVLHAKMKAMGRIALLRERLCVANRKLDEMANRDGLTGLCNRRSLDLRLDAAWDIARQAGRPFGLLMVDIDNFKKYNDRYGHQAGDDCLRAVASALDAAATGGETFAARYGGEEFAVAAPGVPHDELAALARRLGDAVRGLAIPHEDNAQWGIVTLSVGGAHRPVAGGTLAELFAEADACLYRAKQKGRNRIELA
jgi:diguanylate cyclase (GGDEF)-like protein